MSETLISDASPRIALVTGAGSGIGRALAQSEAITAQRVKSQGWAGLAPRVLIEWAAYVYLRVAGVTGRY